MLAAPDVICFGRWRLDPQRRVLLVGGVPVALNGRAFDILALLVERRGEVLSRDQIVSHVWRGLAVGDNNLTVQMSTLRRTLAEHGGAGLVVTVPGRGYRFVGEVEGPDSQTQRETSGEIIQAPPRPLPPVTPLRGRRHVAVFAALALIACVVAGLTWRPAPLPPRLSIAVLPFRNVGADHARDYLVDELTDDLTTDLAHIPGSTVVARESAAFWQNKAVSIQKIGQALNVRYLVEGSVRLDNGQFTVNARLVDASTGVQMWADRLEVAQGKMTEIREAIVRHLASSLDFQLAQIESARSRHDRPNEPDALDLFFRARAIMDSDQSMAGLKDAQAKLEQALKQQPDFADAAAELGAILLVKVEDMTDPDESQDIVEAHRVIAHALAISPRNARALTARAREFANKRDWMRAADSARLAIAIVPSDVDAHTVLARCARARGQLEEAASELQAVLRLMPSGPSSKRRYLTLGFIRLMQSHPQDAIEDLHFATAGDDTSASPDTMDRIEVANILLIASTVQAGDLAHGRSMYGAYDISWPHRSIWRFAAQFYRSDVTLAGFRPMLEALHAAGMPEFAREDSQTPQDQPGCRGGDFAVTPFKIDGVTTWSTADVSSSLKNGAIPLIIDVGSGAAVPPTAFFSDWTMSSSPPAVLAELAMRVRPPASSNTPVVVMSDGPFGCDSYTAARALYVSHPQARIVWYRGGEEAWAAAKMISEDRRP